MKKTGEGKGVIKIQTPIDEPQMDHLTVGDQIEIYGKIYCGRDAVLPKIARMVEKAEFESLGLNLKGSVIFHTAVSPAGIGPTTSNKLEIEGSIPELSKAGVKIHLGKGSLGAETVLELQRYKSVFAITPPVTALFSDKILSIKIAAFKEEGMEALYEVEVKGFPAIIAIAHGKSIFKCR